MHTTNSQTALSPQEAQRLRELENTIQEGYDSFLRIGVAFAEIRYGRLYRATHQSFEAYCQSRWALSLSRCNQIARTMAVYDHIVAAVPQDAALLAEASEHTLRPLSTLSQELQPLVWALVREIEERPTGKTVEETVRVIKEAIAAGWQERDHCSTPAAANGRNGTSQHRTGPRQSDQLGGLSRWVNRINTWDVEAIAAADDNLALKRHLKAARALRTFCEAFIAALETRLSQ